ncbi:MAG: type II/IV secretion system protein [Candidatus Pacebacteria bacterium]|nr:type II/IV secretion system protein [Candidatus Paceibacterota bacterium]
MNIIEELVKRSLISEAQVSEIFRLAREKYAGDLSQALPEFGVTEDTLLQVKSELFGIPARTVDPKSVTFDTLKYIPEDSAMHYKFIPLQLKDTILEVGIIDPSDMSAMDALQFLAAKANIGFTLTLITPTNFQNIYNNYKSMGGEVDTALAELNETDIPLDLAEVNSDDAIIQNSKEKNPTSKDQKKIVEDAPVIKVVAVILRYATDGNASDIHIESTGEKVKVRFRVDGELKTSLWLPLNVYPGVIARIKILSKLKLDEKRKPQDGGFSAKIEGRKIDFRVSTLPTYFGEKVVIRILDPDHGLKTLDNIGISKRNITMIREALKRPYGLILVTGPTGSGKSTTIYSMLNELDREKQNVVSLEDPVEYHIADVAQSQVMPEIGYTFATGLRSILRQDPNIIFVGEIRDKETAQLAIQAALTGHLVLSTLHTNSAVGAIPRLVDMGVDPYLIAPTLVLSMAQRLARKIGPNCKKEIPIDESLQKYIDEQFSDFPPELRDTLEFTSTVYEAVPSAECPSGISGRSAVMEVFSVDETMKSIILKNPIEQDIYAHARSKGMITMREDAIFKSMQGEVPLQEIYNF